MAACRQYIPIRHAEAIFSVNDGTSCRMPSPLPGPLRCQQEREQFGDLLYQELEGPTVVNAGS